MFFANLGHNICDSHAGHMKRYLVRFVISLIERQVRKAEANFKHMYSIKNVLPCMEVLKNTTSVVLTSDEITACDEPIATPVNGAFIKLYHHFAYDSPGVLKCKKIKGQGEYQIHRIRRIGIFLLLLMIYLL